MGKEMKMIPSRLHTASDAKLRAFDHLLYCCPQKSQPLIYPSARRTNHLQSSWTSTGNVFIAPRRVNRRSNGTEETQIRIQHDKQSARGSRRKARAPSAKFRRFSSESFSPTSRCELYLSLALATEACVMMLRPGRSASPYSVLNAFSLSSQHFHVGQPVCAFHQMAPKRP